VHVPHQSAVYAPMLPYLPEPRLRDIGEAILTDARKLAVEAGFNESAIDSVVMSEPRTLAILHQSEDARYVVLGTRTSAVQHLLTGSTTLSVATHAHVPVVSVPRDWSWQEPPSGVLVAGLDGSPADINVMTEAFHQAQSRKALLKLVHAWRPVSPYDAAIERRTLREAWEEAAGELIGKRIIEVAASHPDVVWELSLEFERVPVALHEAAIGADLLVLGRHSHGLPLGLVLGSNTRTQVRTATCPVEVVPINASKEE
jgi:nucleotide-binding universal stress UspA family protein